MASRAEPDLAVVDFETEAIEERPKYPPKPVGLAVWLPGDDPRYFAWGHPTANGEYVLPRGKKAHIKNLKRVGNTTEARARSVLARIYRDKKLAVLFHHSKFDQEVAYEAWDLPILPWERTHDTLYTVFLENPHAPTFSLKPSAERICGIKPEERDAVDEWLKANKVIARNATNGGAHICKAPGDIVGLYAIGDLTRTWAIHHKVLPSFDEGMLRAYDRERRLMPILLENERAGLRLDTRALRRDIPIYEKAQEVSRQWLEKRLKVKGFDPNDKVALGDVLAKRRIVTEWTATKTGKRSVSKKELTVEKFRDKQVFLALGYWGRMQTVLSQSMRPWLAQADEGDGRLYTRWNQVRQTHGNKTSGTKTVRLSASRVMNIAKVWDKDGYEHPKFIRSLPELPLVRRYVLPEVGDLWGHRDYNQQELRILAHFENDQLAREYLLNPRLDIHDYVGGLISEIFGLKLPRGTVKVLNFGKVYGMGVRGIINKLHCEKKDAIKFNNAHRKALPGVRELDDSIKERFGRDEPIREWGGGLIHCEPPSPQENGEVWTWEYKGLNYLIQRSAASCTKEAIIRYHQLPKHRRGKFLTAVHDECNVSMNKARIKPLMADLRDVMMSIEFDIPMLSDGKTGKSWGDLKSFKEPAVIPQRFVDMAANIRAEAA